MGKSPRYRNLAFAPLRSLARFVCESATRNRGGGHGPQVFLPPLPLHFVLDPALTLVDSCLFRRQSTRQGAT